MNPRCNLTTGVASTNFLLGVKQQKLPGVVVRNAVHRTLRGERPTNIISLPQQPLGQDRLADDPLLLPVIRQ